jgi:hypothetical protein
MMMGRVPEAAAPDLETARTTAVQKYINQERRPALYSTALRLVGSAQVWAEQITLPDGTLRGDYSNVTDQIHIWEGNFASPAYWLPWTMAHEAAHAIGYQTEEEAHPYGDSCLNFTMNH